MSLYRNLIKSLPFASGIIRKYKVYKKQNVRKQMMEKREQQVAEELKRAALWIERHKEKSQILYTSKPLVSMIVLNRNGTEHLNILLKSLLEKTFYDNYELIVVDNASTDGSIEFLESFVGKINLHIIRNNENMSFSKANNLAVREASGEYLLFLNNDTEVTDGWLDELLFIAMEKEKAGAIGARLLYPEIPVGSTNQKKSYCIQHYGIGFRKVKRNGVDFVQPYNMENGSDKLCKDFEAVREMAVTAAVLLVSRQIFEEVGGYDEGYNYGYEDVDLCLKIHYAGYQNYLAPAVVVFHYEFGTQNKDDQKEVEERRLHNMYVYQGKWQNYLQRKILREGKEAPLDKQKLDICIAELRDLEMDTDNADTGGLKDYKYALHLKDLLEEEGYSVEIRPYAKWSNDTTSLSVLVIRGDRPYYPKVDPQQKNILILRSDKEESLLTDEAKRFDKVFVESNYNIADLLETIKESD